MKTCTSSMWAPYRWLSVIILVAVAFIGIGAPALADPSPSPQPSDGATPTDGATPPGAIPPEQTNQPQQQQSDQYSLYSVASTLASIFSNQTNPKALAENKGFENVIWHRIINEPGSAGGFLAYPDENLSPDSGWLFQKQSKNSARPGYNALDLEVIEQQGENKGTTYQSDAITSFGYYGAAVKGLGLDNVATYIGGKPNTFYTAGAGLLSAMFLLSTTVDTAFATVIDILQATNPFRLLAVGVGKAFGGTGSQVAAMTGGEGVPPAMQGAANFLASAYGILRDFGLFAIMPLMVALTLFSLATMTNKRRQGGARGKIAADWIRRIVFLAVAVPLLGGSYTATLDAVKKNLNSDAGTTNIITSTFVDYSSWATNNRFAVPAGAKIEWDSAAHTVTSESETTVRDTARRINKEAAGLGTTGIDTSSLYINGGGKKSTGGGPAIGSYGDVLKVNGLLLSYVKGETVSGDEFASYMQKGAVAYGQKGKDGENGKEVEKWYKTLTELAQAGNGTVGTDGGNTDGGGEGDEGEGDGNEGDGNGNEGDNSDGDSTDTNADKEKAITNNPLVALTSNSGLQNAQSGNINKFNSTRVSGCKGPDGRNGRHLLNTDSNPSPRKCNLTPVATYNMLMTDFGTESASVYSGPKTTTTNSAIRHYSVNLVGAGAMKMFYLTNAVVSTGSITIMGLLFAGGMLIGSFKRYIPMISSAVTSQVGMLSMMGKFMGYTLGLITEVVVTLCVYVLFQEIIIALPGIVEAPITQMVSGVTGHVGVEGFNSLAGATNALSSGGMMLGLGLIIIIQLVFLITGIRSRKRILDGINSAIDTLISRLMGTKVSTAGATASGIESAAGAAGLVAAGATGAFGAGSNGPAGALGALGGGGQHGGHGASGDSGGSGIIGVPGDQSQGSTTDGSTDSGSFGSRTSGDQASSDGFSGTNSSIGMDTSNTDAAGNGVFNANPGLGTDTTGGVAAGLDGAHASTNMAGISGLDGSGVDGSHGEGAQGENAEGEKAQAGEAAQGDNAGAAVAGGGMDTSETGVASAHQASMAQGADSDADTAGGADVRDAQSSGAAARLTEGAQVGADAQVAGAENGENVTQSGDTQGVVMTGSDTTSTDIASSRAAETQAEAGVDGTSATSTEGAQAGADGAGAPGETASFAAAAGPLGQHMGLAADSAQTSAGQNPGTTPTMGGENSVGAESALSSGGESTTVGGSADAQRSQSFETGISSDGSRVSTAEIGGQSAIGMDQSAETPSQFGETHGYDGATAPQADVHGGVMPDVGSASASVAQGGGALSSDSTSAYSGSFVPMSGESTPAYGGTFGSMGVENVSTGGESGFAHGGGFTPASSDGGAPVAGAQQTINADSSGFVSQGSQSFTGGNISAQANMDAGSQMNVPAGGSAPDTTGFPPEHTTMPSGISDRIVAQMEGLHNSYAQSGHMTMPEFGDATSLAKDSFGAMRENVPGNTGGASG